MSTMEGLVKEIDEEHGRLVTDANAKVAITADCWSSQNLSCSLLGMTAHVLSPNFADRENIVLDCIPLDGSRFLENHSLPIKIPFRDCPTRWGSTFTMICDILDSLPAFGELLTTLKMDPFEEEEARFLRAMKTFLEPFSHMTKQVCSQRATCSMHIAELRKRTQGGKMFGEALLAKATSYFKPWFDDEFLQTAALCDPRFAFLETVLTLEEWRATVDRMVNRAVHNWEDPAADEGEDSPAAEDNMRVIKTETVSKTPHAWDVLLEDEEAVASPGPSTREDEIRIEIQQYSMLLKKPGAPLQFDSNPIEWWRTHKGKFPLMASQVPAYLVAPPSSADCERLFSTASLLYGNKRRGRLSSKTARTLLLVKVHSDAKIARKSRSWTALEAKRYGYPENIEDIFCSSSDEEACSVTEDDSIIEEDEF
ncbi:dimerization domain protein, hAT family [Ancylostoma caninum]|uniref:Dimerization domain protein, hAT family n=1 Tax=Ancylostoma caninum TaxID=29170 RepID=A0A368GSL4_ANCCA|nr:dimerization domain protein, hAT family [Ancylostoma caninum]